MIEFKNIEIKYGDYVAIKDLNLTIKDGEFFTFLGPSGCGKTTTLRALVGFLQPSNGEILVDGKDITKIPVEQREIGMVFQSYALFPTMTVYENIAFGLKIKKLSKQEIDKKVREVAQVVEIKEEQLTRNVSELSGGQQQRVALARAIILEPKILCLDEPLSNLDAKLRVGLREELKRLQKTLGITTLYVTHDQEEALALSDRIAVFHNGKIEQVDTPYTIYNRSTSEFVCDFIGDINKINPTLMKLINEKLDHKLDAIKTSYLRLERIKMTESEGDISFEATIKEYEYHGVFIKYTIDLLGETLRLLKVNDGSSILQINEKIKVYINPQDIMQF